MAIAMNYSNDFGFDVVNYIKRLRNVGVSQEIAEVQGQELAHVVRIVTHEVKDEVKNEIRQELNSDDLATKGDIALTRVEIKGSELCLQKEIELVRKEIKEVELRLQKEIKELEVKIANVKNELIKWILGVGIAATIAVCSAMVTMLKFMIH